MGRFAALGGDDLPRRDEAARHASVRRRWTVVHRRVHPSPGPVTAKVAFGSTPNAIVPFRPSDRLPQVIGVIQSKKPELLEGVPSADKRGNGMRAGPG